MQAALIIQTSQLKENGGNYILHPGTITRVKLATLTEVQEAGGLTPQAIPIYPVNKEKTLKTEWAVEGEDPIVMRAVMDGLPTGYIAIPVYVEED